MASFGWHLLAKSSPLRLSWPTPASPSRTSCGPSSSSPTRPKWVSHRPGSRGSPRSRPQEPLVSYSGSRASRSSASPPRRDSSCSTSVRSPHTSVPASSTTSRSLAATWVWPLRLSSLPSHDRRESTESRSGSKRTTGVGVRQRMPSVLLPQHSNGSSYAGRPVMFTGLRCLSAQAPDRLSQQAVVPWHGAMSRGMWGSRCDATRGRHTCAHTLTLSASPARSAFRRTDGQADDLRTVRHGGPVAAGGGFPGQNS